MEYRIVLASGSPRRKELLGKILDKYNMKFDIIPSDAEEEFKGIITDPQELVEKLSSIKAIDIFDKIKEENEKLIVIGADTIVYFNGEILGKPGNSQNAIKTLEKLQGNINNVYTGMTVIVKNNNNVTNKVVCSKTDVYFKPMSDQDILEYVETGEPLDKSGGYGIMGIGRKYIEKYDGELNTVAGLDTVELEKILSNYMSKTNIDIDTERR